MEKMRAKKEASRRRRLVTLIVSVELVIFILTAIASSYFLFYVGLAVIDETNQKRIEEQVERQGYATYEQRHDIDSYDIGREESAKRNDVYKWAYLSNTSHTGVFIRAIALVVNVVLWAISFLLSLLCVRKLSKMAIRCLKAKAKRVARYMKSLKKWITTTVLSWIKVKCNTLKTFAKSKIGIKLSIER